MFPTYNFSQASDVFHEKYDYGDKGLSGLSLHILKKFPCLWKKLNLHVKHGAIDCQPLTNDKLPTISYATKLVHSLYFFVFVKYILTDYRLYIMYVNQSSNLQGIC